MTKKQDLNTAIKVIQEGYGIEPSATIIGDIVYYLEGFRKSANDCPTTFYSHMVNRPATAKDKEGFAAIEAVKNLAGVWNYDEFVKDEHRIPYRRAFWKMMIERCKWPDPGSDIVESDWEYMKRDRARKEMERLFRERMESEKQDSEEEH